MDLTLPDLEAVATIPAGAALSLSVAGRWLSSRAICRRALHCALTACSLDWNAGRVARQVEPGPSGRVNQKVAPCPDALSTPTCPPCRSIIVRAM